MLRTAFERPTAALAVAMTLGLAAPGMAQLTGIQSSNPTPRPPDRKSFVVDAMSAPVPAFRYRLLPTASERTTGDAAPVYLRIAHATPSESLRQISEKYVAWVQKSTEPFPTAEARAFVDSWGGRTQQLAFGARRKSCDWAYTLPEQRAESLEILLPDAQEMRTWGRLLEIKARVEVAEGNFDEAIRTYETGLGFARHVGKGPFLINVLVGVAMSTSIVTGLEDLSARPGAPNLYWALTALPRPLVSMRTALENEAVLGENLVPELTGLDRPRTEAEWSSLYLRLIERLDGLRTRYKLDDPGSGLASLLPRAYGPTAFKARFLDEARRALAGRPVALGPMTDDRALVLFVADRYRALRDDQLKPRYLPFAESAGLAAEAEARMKAEKVGPAAVFDALMPAMGAAMQAEVRLDRRVAALRVVEALRMHAAAHGGKLPATLAEVTVVPIPLDPATARPFEYRLDGDTATLTAPPARLAPPWIDHRITIRK